MKILNPTKVFNDFKSGKIDGPTAIESLLSMSLEMDGENVGIQAIDILLEMYRYAEADENEESEHLKSIFEEVIAKKFISKYNIFPREAVALAILEMISGAELENEDEIPELHHVHAAFKVKEGHVIDIDIVEVSCPKITFIDFFPNLTFLRINMSGLKEIRGLEKLVKLEWIDLGVNNLTKIEGLENLQRLKKLHIFHNKITQLNGLDSLAKLEELFIQENPIKRLKGIKNLEKLKHIEFYETDLSEKEIIKIKKMIN